VPATGIAVPIKSALNGERQPSIQQGALRAFVVKRL
jgi:hypothetical protein